MKQPAYFIEVVRKEGHVKHSRPMPIRLFSWSMEVNWNHDIEIIALFKIYPK